MTKDEFEKILAEKNLNQRLAVRELSQDERLSLLSVYYSLAEPIKSTCQNVSNYELMIIRVMCELYNQFFQNHGGNYAPVRSSACSLPDSLSKVRRVLVMSGRV